MTGEGRAQTMTCGPCGQAFTVEGFFEHRCEAGRVPTTYTLTLDALDEAFTKWVCLPQGYAGIVLQLPRQEWEQMDRPSRIFVTPVASPWSGDPS